MKNGKNSKSKFAVLDETIFLFVTKCLIKLYPRKDIAKMHATFNIHAASINQNSH